MSARRAHRSVRRAATTSATARTTASGAAWRTGPGRAVPSRMRPRAGRAARRAVLPGVRRTDPVQTCSAPSGVGERASDESAISYHRTEIGERSGQRRDGDAVDRHDVAGLERGDVVGDHRGVELPAVTAIDGELEGGRAFEPVEGVQARRCAVRGDGRRTPGHDHGREAVRRGSHRVGGAGPLRGGVRCPGGDQPGPLTRRRGRVAWTGG